MKPIEVINKLNEADQSWRHKVMEAKLSNYKDNPVWIIGDVRVGQKSYHVNAKTFMEPSKFGIGGGPTSKLMIQDNKGKTICNYDRGWDVEPKDGEETEICNTILNYIEEWRTRNPYEVSE